MRRRCHDAQRSASCVIKQYRADAIVKTNNTHFSETAAPDDAIKSKSFCAASATYRLLSEDINDRKVMASV